MDEIPPRILLGLVEDLPDEGALAAAVQGGREFQGWGVDRHILANVWDLIAAANTDPKKKPPQHPRPNKRKPAGPSMRDLARAATRQQRG